MSHEIAKTSYEQCQFVSAGRRCEYVCNTDSRFCSTHNSNALTTSLAGSLRYKLLDSDRVTELRDSPNPKHLYDEIALLRAMLETIWNMIQKEQSEGNAHAFLQNHSKVTDTIDKIDKLVTNTHKIEKSLGHLLDQSQLYAVIEQIIDVIEKELVNHPELCKAIAIGIQSIVIKPFESVEDL